MENLTGSNIEKLDNVYDLVKYRLEKQIKGLPPNDFEVELIQNVIKLYETGVITVGWDDYDIWVKMRDESAVPPELLYSFSAEEKEVLKEVEEMLKEVEAEEAEEVEEILKEVEAEEAEEDKKE